MTAYLTIFADGDRRRITGHPTPKIGRGMLFGLFDYPSLKTRVADLVFVLDEIARRSGEAGSLWANIATDDVGVFGHSFGGATALMLAGAR